MTREQALFLLTCKAVLETVKEADVPHSMIYMAVGMDMDKTTDVLSFLTKNKAVTVKNHLVRKSERFDTVLNALVEFETKLKSLNAN